MTAETARPTAPAPTPGPASGTRARARQLAIGVAALVLVGAAVAVPLARGDDAPVPLDPTTLVPTLDPVDAERFPDQLDAVPPSGTAVQLSGPFDEGVALDGLALAPTDATGGPAAVGAVQVTRDVSTLIVLELRAGFYDAEGRLLGSDRLVLRQPDFTRAYEAGVIAAPYNAPLPFRIEAPPAAAGAASAVVALPVLVNE